MIFLIGMPASGKSYWGRLIAAEWRLPLADLDELIKEAEKITIAEIFQQKGVSYFRDKEQDILQHVIANFPENTVVACGGGTPVYYNNMHLMKEKGCVVYIDTKIDILFDRLANDSTRPLITNTDIYESLKTLFSQREAVYKQAHYILQSESLSLRTFAKIIEQCTNLH